MMKSDLGRVNVDRAVIVFTYVFFLFVIQFPMENIGGQGLTLVTNSVSLIVWSVFGFIGFVFIIRRDDLIIDRFVYGYIALILLLCVPLIWSVQKFGGVQRLYVLIVGLFAYVVFLNCKEETLKHLFWVIALSAGFQVLMGLVQYFFLFNGLSRPYGSFFQVNVYSNFVLVGMVSSYFLLSKVNAKYSVNWILSAFVVTGGTFVLSLVLSRSAILSFAVCTALLCFGSFKEKKYREITTWLLMVVAGIVLSLVNSVFTKSAPRDIDVMASGGERVDIYRNVLEMISENFLFGRGLGSFQTEYSSWVIAQESLGREVGHSHLVLSHPHNELLLWFFEGGLLALLAILSFVIFSLSILVRSNKRWFFGLALLMPLSLHSMFELPFYHSIATWFLFIMLISMVMRSSGNAVYVLNAKSYRVMRLPLLFVSMVVVLFFTTTVHKLKIIEHVSKDLYGNVPRLSYSLNPYVLKDQTDYLYARVNLRNSILLGDLSSILSAIEVSKETFEQFPHFDLYIEQILALYIVGMEEESKQLFQAGRLIYDDFSLYPSELTFEQFVSNANDYFR